MSEEARKYELGPTDPFYHPMHQCRHQFVGGSLFAADQGLPGHRECIVCGLVFAPTGMPLAYNRREEPVHGNVSCDHTPGKSLVRTGEEDGLTTFECVNCGFELRLRLWAGI